MPTSVRLDKKTETLVKQLAKKTRKTRSAVIRDAIALLAREEAARPTGTTAYEAMKDLIGVVKGGPPVLSERTGEKFTALLLEQRKVSE